MQPDKKGKAGNEHTQMPLFSPKEQVFTGLLIHFQLKNNYRNNFKTTRRKTVSILCICLPFLPKGMLSFEIRKQFCPKF